ncbi:MAG: helix-turn-helix transcriptional regulator [Hylemonella sp.]|jgi:transcriptional regulator with XRE-family HTH domain|nr:helix-turn-helix transcriptional regulator [Hylemonella sp.]
MMPYSEFRRHLGKAGLTINQFAAYLGVRPSSVSNYAKSGTVPRTYTMLVILLGECADRGLDPATIFARFNVFPIGESGSNASNVRTLHKPGSRPGPKTAA